jgi:WD40 repeat protein
MLMKAVRLFLIFASVALTAGDAAPKPPFQPLHPEKLKLVGRLGEMRFRHASSITSILRLPDGNILLTSRDHSARIWDAKTGAELRRFTSSEDMWGSALLPDGKSILLCSSEKTVTQWSLETGQLLKTFKGHEASVFRVTPFAGGKRFVSGSSNGKVLLWNIETETFNELKGMPKSAYCVAISPDEKIAAACGEKGACMWNVASGELIRQLPGLTDDTYTIAFSPDGKTLATCSGDKTLRLWNVEDGKQLWSVSPGRAHVLAFSPAGDRIVLSINESEKQNSIRVFNSANGSETLKIEDAFAEHWPCCFSADGKEILACADMLYRWDAETGKALDGPAANTHSSEVKQLALAADGKLYSLGTDSRVIQWDPASGAGKQVFRAEAVWDYDMTLHAGRRVLLAATHEKKLATWDVVNGGKKLQEFDVENMHGNPRFAPQQDKLLVRSYGGKFMIFDHDKGTQLQSLGGNPNGNVNVVNLAIHEGVLASAQDDGNVKYWDLNSGAELDEISVLNQKDKNDVRHCVFLKNGNQLLTVGQTGVVNLWTRGVSEDGDGKPADLAAALKQLGDDDFNTRQNAVKILGEGGDKTLKLLNAEAESKDPEVVRRIEQVRAQIRKSVLPLQRASNEISIEDVQRIVAHPDGVRFAVTAGDGVEGQLLIGKAGRDGPELVCRIRDGHSPNALCFSVDGKKLFVGNRDSTISIYELGE